jgi:hypothetical protein
VLPKKQKSRKAEKQKKENISIGTAAGQELLADMQADIFQSRKALAQI